MRDDAQEINDRLIQEIEAVLNRFFPGWIVNPAKKSQGLLSPRLKGKSKHPTSSFQINLYGQNAGAWYRFSAGVGGGMVALVYYAEHGSVPSSKQDWAEAFRIAREYLGMETRPARQETEAERIERERKRDEDRREREQKRADDERKLAEARAEKTQTAVEIWNSALPLSGSHAEAYLIARGIAPVRDWPWNCKNVLRFHPSIDCELDKRSGLWPALIGLVEDPFGEPTAIWQVYLDRNEAKKAPLDNNKIGRGPTNGGAIRIGGMAARIGVAEGMESALGVYDLEAFRMPVWSLMSTSPMVAFEPPIGVESISIYQDADKGMIDKASGRVRLPPGESAAKKLQERMQQIGIRTNLNPMPMLGDGLDLKNVYTKIEKAGRH